MGPESRERANPASPRPLSSWLCDALCFGAALWTLCCHAVVASGGSHRDLLIVAAIALAIALAIATGACLWWRDRVRSGFAAPTRETRGSLGPPDGDPFPRVARVAGGLFGVAAVAIASGFGNTLAVWGACVATLGFALAVTLWRCPQPVCGVPAVGGRGREIALWALALACALVALQYRRADLDMPFYLSLAIAAADAPDQPLMRDTLHGIAGLGLHMPAHRLHSFEVFIGTGSWLTGWRAIAVYQIAVAAVSAAFVPLAFARLFRILTPAHWPWPVIGVLVVLIGGGGALSWYGNLSIVRIFHGKSVYMSVLLPLVYAYGLRFGAQPNAARWLRLCAAQIAALGLTSSALWSAPIAAGLAAACAVRLDRQAWRTLGLAALSSAYLVAAGALLSIDLAPISATITDAAPGVRLDEALARTLGGGRLEFAAFAAAAIAWAVLPNGAARRFAIAIPFAILVLVLNPYTSDTVQRYVTGPSYWRALWSFPVPILLALVLTAPMQWSWGGRPLGRALGGATAAAALWGFVALVPTYSSISPRNQVRRTPIGVLTIPVPYYAVARELGEQAAPDAMVVAPQKVALWAVSFHHHPTVSSAREAYLRRIESEHGIEEVDLRMGMSELVSAPSDIEQRIRNSPGFVRRAADPHAVRRFRYGLQYLDVQAVCVNDNAPQAQRVHRVLREAGFVKRVEIADYEVWARGN